MLQKLFRGLFPLMLTAILFLASGCAEQQYYHPNHYHTRRYYDRHHTPPPPGVRFDIHN